jgi:serine/threonine protein kinase
MKKPMPIPTRDPDKNGKGIEMIGKTLGHYEITSQLGKGGMGEVYQAKDQKLGRDVAIKVLPEEFANDTDRVARFQREAKLLASLNHPSALPFTDWKNPSERVSSFWNWSKAKR